MYLLYLSERPALNFIEKYTSPFPYMIQEAHSTVRQPVRESSLPSIADERKQFAHDVQVGLSSRPKRLPSKYFYDETGDRLFQEIMHMPAYYLTRLEYTILDQYKGELLCLFNGKGDSFNLIEFGAGDGLKTKLLLQHFSEQKAPFRYIPIDISGHVLQVLVRDLEQQLPDVTVEAVQRDYFQALSHLSKKTPARNVVLFLGSNIGNFAEEEAIRFLTAMGENLNGGDLALIGFDLKKNPELILQAYNDPAGITRSFNLNLLARINKELEASFALDKFQHWPTYDPESGEARSYLVSTTAQQVSIGALKQTFQFKAWESIHVEISRKYDTATIRRYATKAGFIVKQLYYDQDQYYVNALWERM